MTEDNRIAEIRAVLDEVIPQTNWGMTAREHVGLVAQQRVRRIRAILEARPPARKPCEYVVSHWAGQEGSECVAFAEPGSDYCKPHGDALKALSGEALRDVEERDDASEETQ